MIQRANGRTTVPQIFIDGKHVGGCDDLMALERAGKLDELIAGMTRIALFQSSTGIDPAANAGALVDAVDEAAAGGAAMLFTPEMSGLLDRDCERAASNLGARGRGRGARRRAGRRRSEHGIWLHLGSLAVLADDGKVANRGFVIDRDGRGPRPLRQDPFVRRRFADRRKLARSPRSIAAGDGAVLVNGTPVGKLGLTICYDLRFPVLFARLAEAGADVISVPAAFTVPTGQAHWHVLLRARAIEAGLFVVAAAQTRRRRSRPSSRP